MVEGSIASSEDVPFVPFTCAITAVIIGDEKAENSCAVGEVVGEGESVDEIVVDIPSNESLNPSLSTW